MSIVLEQLNKRYGGLLVVDRVSLSVADGELFVLLGTSGSGKSTILRLIAGLAQPDGGSITLHGRDVTPLPPQQRGTGFVFQNYSIFRHMSVAENIEFGLRIRKMPLAERTQKRDELLELVGMAGLGNRYADQLSGGQQQRVALARALAYEPKVLLLDEPFGALDVKTRGQLRRSLKEVQRKLNVTAILVTHDQDEAFALGDRIGVLDRGKLLEVERPEKLYANPRTLFAATFLGAGTVLVGRTRQDKGVFGPVVLPIPEDVPHEDGAPVQVLFRPEQVMLSTQKPEDDKTVVIGCGSVIEQNFTGALRRVRLRLPRLPATRQISPLVPFGEEGMFVDAVIPSEAILANQDLWVSLRGWQILQQPRRHLLVFDDGASTSSTLALARLLVDEMDASATLLAVSDDRDEVETQRAAILARQQAAGLGQAELHVRVGDQGEQITIEQNEALYSLVMLAPRVGKSFVGSDEHEERRRLKHVNRLGPTVMKVLERPSAPVMIVKKERRQLKRILICTALGEPGKNDVRVGGRLARALGASVTLIYITRETEDPGPRVKAHLDLASSTLRALDVPVDVSLRKARIPAKGILAASREGDYDLIVLGHHGPQSDSVFGRDDVTLQVLVGADRPVLVVPAEDAR
jgi:sulfate/thiosulfate transport system ATP-binding protein